MPSPIASAAAITALVSQIRLALNSRAGGRLGGTVQGAQLRDPARRSRETGSTAARRSATGLPALIAGRIEVLDPDASDFSAQLLRLVVEAALLQEFGNHLINSPGFQGMVDQVASEIMVAPELQNEIHILLQDVRAS